MEQRISHACGHEQVHSLHGFPSQQDRKARWLQTTKCRACFVADKQVEQAVAAGRNEAAIAHLDLPQFIGSDRQVAWATTIRAGRFAAIVAASVVGHDSDHEALRLIANAKWWIDHRDLIDIDLLTKAMLPIDAGKSSGAIMSAAQAA